MKNDNKGFSLIELIVVIAIMAVLVGVMAPQVMKYVESSKQSTDIQNCAAVRTAVEVGVTEGAISSDVTVATDASGKVTVSGTGVDAALSAVGVATEFALKSTTWPKSKTIATYKIADYEWDADDGTNTTNSSYPSKVLGSAFQ